MVEVVPERLAGWVERFTTSHGEAVVEVGGDRVVLRASDGEVADLEVPWSPLRRHGPGDPARTPRPAGDGDDVPAVVVAALADHAARPRTALLLLVRRGGYAVGTAREGRLLDHSTGTRYVQSRTAAGGWSQQRYARRRSGQSAALVGAATAALATVLARAEDAPEVLVVGGDRLLVDAVLAGSGDGVAALPRSPLLDVGDPRLAVLVDVAARARAVRVRVKRS